VPCAGHYFTGYVPMIVLINPILGVERRFRADVQPSLLRASEMIRGRGDAVNVGDLARELRQLQRGEGMGAADLDQHVGDLLRTVCGADSNDDSNTLRRRLTELITQHVEVLSDDDKRAVLASLALHPDAQFRFLKDRQNWVLGRIDRDSRRTVDRRAGRGMRRVAEEIVAEYEQDQQRPSNRFAPRSFYTAELISTVRLDLDRPEWSERRTIVALEPLDHVPVGASVPAAPDGSSADIELDVVAGGTLTEWKRAQPTFFEGRIELDRPVARGERYGYEIRRRISSADDVQPYYLMTAHVRCDRLVVHVVLGSAGPAWAVDGVPWPTVADGTVMSAPPLIPDASGQVSAEFARLHLGPAYGIVWRSAESSAAEPPQ
jgi:hypothetical protein